MPILFHFRFILIVFVLFFAGNGQAEIYKWTDEHGQTHFGDRPPQHQKATDISGQLESINISRELSTPEMMLQLEHLKAKEREQQSSSQQTQKERERSLSKACNQAQKVLRKLKGRVVFLDEQGSEIKVTEAERKKQALEMEAAVREHCL